MQHTILSKAMYVCLMSDVNRLNAGIGYLLLQDSACGLTLPARFCRAAPRVDACEAVYLCMVIYIPVVS